jgi:hypothetical protein
LNLAVVNPEHLLEQADYLLRDRNSRGRVRQTSRRRAISTAYYAVFHAILTALADEFVGASERATMRYALAYRSIDHGDVEKLAKEAKKQVMPPKYQRFAPTGGFCPGVREFAALILQLKEQRNRADYDPSYWATIADARTVIASARKAIQHFVAVEHAETKLFLSLLLFPPR